MGRADGPDLAPRAAVYLRRGAGGAPLVVGVLTTSYPRFAGDYAGCFVEDTVNGLLAAGHQVEVFAAGTPDAPPVVHQGPLTVHRIAPAVPSGVAPLFYSDGAPEMLERPGLLALPAWAQGAAYWAGLCSALRQRRAVLDRLLSHWLLPCGAAALAVAPDLPVAAYAHSGDVALLERLPAGRALARWLAGRAAGHPASELVFVTQDLAQRFAALAGRPVGRVERLTASAEQFPPRTSGGHQEARRRLGLTRPTVVSAGRLVPIKGFDVLVAACAQLRAADGDPPEVVIIGDGPLRAALGAQADRLRVPLRLPGFIPRAVLADWLRAADVYAQPSRILSGGRTEGLPVSTLEARALGLPVVASRTGGLAELPGSDAFITVPPGDASALATALAAVLKHWPGGPPFVTAV